MPKTPKAAKAPKQPKAPKTALRADAPLLPTNPVVAPPGAAAGATVVPNAVDLKLYKDGTFKDIQSGEEFSLLIDKDDTLGRTHKLKNKEHFWEGTEAEFRAKFEKP